MKERKEDIVPLTNYVKERKEDIVLLTNYVKERKEDIARNKVYKNQESGK